MNATSSAIPLFGAPEEPADRRFPISMTVIAGLLLALWPVWRWYGLRLDDGSDEPMGLVALAVAGWFLWEQRGRLSISGRSLLLATMGLAIYAQSFSLMPSLVRAIFGLIIFGVAFRFDRISPGIWGLLLLSLPVIATAQFFAGWPLRLFTAWGAEGLLHLGGLEVTRTGTVLWWGGTPVGMDAPCSGIQMLWTGLFMHFLLAARNRVSLLNLLWLTPCALGGIILANLFRATGVFLKECGAISLPDWAHDGLGLLCFAAVILSLSKIYSSISSDQEIANARKGERKDLPSGRIRGAFLAAAFLAALMPAVQAASKQTTPSAEGEVAAFPGWPTEWEGRDLVEVPLDEAEQAFAKNFPGKVAVFRTAEGPLSKRLILRWVFRPTRKLHSSADCLKAAGFTMDPRPGVRGSGGGGDRWSVWSAYDSEHGSFRVRERLWESADPETGWSEVSAWFWQASLGRSTGPWWAVTVMEPES